MRDLCLIFGGGQRSLSTELKILVPAFAMTTRVVMNSQSFSQSFFTMTTRVVIFVLVAMNHHYDEKHGKLEVDYNESFD